MIKKYRKKMFSDVLLGILFFKCINLKNANSPISDSGQRQIKAGIEIMAFVQHYSEINREW